MPTALNVLIVEDNPDDAELMVLQLTAAGFHSNWQRVESEADYRAHLTPPPDLILCDWRLPRFSGLHALRLLREEGLDIPFVIVSGSIGEEVAIDALREGAYGYVLKDSPSRLGMAVQRALQDKQSRLARQQAETRLYESEERFRVALKNSPVVVFNQDRELRYTWIYNAHPDFDPQAVLGKTDAELLPSDESARLTAIKRMVLQSGVSAREEVQATISGQPFFYDLTVEPLIDASGAIVGVTCASINITERKRYERELEMMTTVSGALRKAVTRAEMLPIILDQLITLLQVEGAALEMVNPLNRELLIELGRGVWAPLTGVTIAPGVGLSAQILNSGQPYLNNDAHTDARLFRPDAFGPCRAVAGVPLVAQGEIIGLLWIGSKRRLGDHELRLLTATANIAANAIHRAALHEQTQAQASQMTQIINTVPQGLLLLDDQGSVLLANQVAMGDLALLAPATTNNRITQLASRPLAELLTALPDGLWHELETENHIFEIVAKPIRDQLAPEQWVMLINDVTKARQVQAQLQQQERLATVGQLAAGIAHDFNNILTIILTYSHLLRQTPGLSERNQHRLNVISEQMQRATDLTRQLLDFSRKSVLERRWLDLLPLLKEQIKLLERILPESIVLRLEYDQDEYIIHADLTSIQQVVMNLVINARDAMPSGGTLTMGLRGITITPEVVPLPKMPAGNWVQLTVKDSGMGIAPEILPHIFDPFFTTKGPGQGTGLGLAQVYGIVTQHGGYLDVKTEVAVGTTFFIYLPALIVQVPTLPPAEAATLLQGQGQLLLIVEDNLALRMALADMLSLLGYTVIEAANGQEALYALATRGDEVALMLSDVVMPEKGGIELLHTLRKRGWTKPVILLTGHPLDQETETLWSQNVQALLLKPPSLAELAQTITAALGSIGAQ